MKKLVVVGACIMMMTGLLAVEPWPSTYLTSFTVDDLDGCPVLMLPGEATGTPRMYYNSLEFGYTFLNDAWPPVLYRMPECPYSRSGYRFAGWKCYHQCAPCEGSGCTSFTWKGRDLGVIQGTCQAGEAFTMCGLGAIVATWEKVGGFDCSSAQLFNGMVYGDSTCEKEGIVQVATSKVDKKGMVKVSGFVMLSDGKKQSIKSVSGRIENGKVNVTTTVGKLGYANLTIDENGFEGTLGNLTLISEETNENTGVFTGTLKFQYFDPNTGKIKSRSITVGGVSLNGDIVGNISEKKKPTIVFSTYID